MAKKTNTPKTKSKEKVEIGITQANRDGVVKLLSAALADNHVLYIKTRNLHWNLVGPRFHSLHEFYEEQYTEMAKNIDAIAERIRMVGGAAPGSMAEFLKAARLKEKAGARIEGTASLELLLADNEEVVRYLREAIDDCEEKYDDVGTADFLTGLIQVHEEASWMFRSYLE